MIFDWLQIGGGALVALFLGYAAHTIDVSMIKSHDAEELKTAKETLTKQCNDDKKIATEASHAYQIDHANTTSELIDVKRVQPNSCIVLPSSSTTAGSNGSPAIKRPSKGHATTTEQFYDFSGQCKDDRDKLKRLQQFNAQVWTENGQ